LRRLIIAVLPLAVALPAFAACSDDGEAPAATSSRASTATAAPSPSSRPSATPAPTPEATLAPFTALFTNSDGETIALSIEVADTPEERSVGLMNRESLPENAGMLFDFGGETNSGFWMRNTLLPLSIAFVAADGTILHIEDMQPQTEDLHFSPTQYRYAIEVNQGWFSENGISVGDSVHFRTD
jgi:uncharacterized membrane protein (UPF0127 family)